ncbi:MAG: glycosyl transferase [Nitrospirales bacterium]|nr:MAG: glycosyl transferase [Nitrospirales bacterium]
MTSSMKRIHILQISDTLNAAGRQRLTVNLVNLIQNSRYRNDLCTTRGDGPLESQVRKDVGRLRLSRKHKFEFAALRRLVRYIRDNQVDILHAHAESLFIASLASLFPPYPRVIWHDNDGNHGQAQRSTWLYRLGVSRVNGVISATRELAEWSKNTLGIPEECVWYVPNLVCFSEEQPPSTGLPGEPGMRIVCVARIQPQKDHLTLVRAMAMVIKQFPNAHLLVVGKSGESSYHQGVLTEIKRLQVEDNVSLLGERQDIHGILQSCDIGVLSSASEAFPLALLEYGIVGLPVVATNVGQCAEVLDAGRVGGLVPPGSPEKLAEMLMKFLRSHETSVEMGRQFNTRIKNLYSPESIQEKICEIYDTVLHPVKK